MKKILALVLALTLSLGLLAGCGEKKDPAPATGNSPTVNEPSGKKGINVALLIAGNLGDKGFNDMAATGAEEAAQELGITYKVVEMTADSTKYEPTMLDISESGEYDLITCSGYAMKEVVEKVAPQFPEQKYLIYDSSVDYTAGDFSNVYSVGFKQNEASYLAGIVAARMTTSDLEGMNPQKLIGNVIVADMTVMNDFMVGYVEGALSIDPETKVNIAYIGAVDAAKGKDMAEAQVTQGADIVFPVAASAGLGVIAGAVEKGAYCIGVDKDQAEELMASDPDTANRIITSVMKRIDQVVYRTIKLMNEDPTSLPWGTSETLGLGDGAVGLAKNDIYKKMVDADTQKMVEDAQAKIIAGEIKVGTSFGMDSTALDNVRNSVKP